MEETKNRLGSSTHDAIVVDSDDCDHSGDTNGDSGHDSPTPKHALPTPTRIGTYSQPSIPSAPSNKRARREGTKTNWNATGVTEDIASGATAQETKGNLIHPCPIKLLATQQDEDARKAHYEKTNNKDHWSYHHCWTLREMLGLDRHTEDEYGPGSIDWMVVSNFIVDFRYLLHEMPEFVSIPTVLVIYGHADDPAGIEAWKGAAAGVDSHVDFVRRDPSDRRGSPSNPLPVSIPFGCHHTKLFLVGYASGRLRVIVHTSNLRFNDVHLKCQGAFLQDFWPKSEEQELSTSDFEESLISYLSTYRYLEQRTWKQRSQPSSSTTGSSPLDTYPCSLMDQISKYNFSTAKGVLIPSAPGFHAPKPRGPCWGYLKVRQAIVQKANNNLRSINGGGGAGSIVCQFSSIGSLSEKYLKSLWDAWDVNSVLKSNGTAAAASSGQSQQEKPRFQLIYPTYGEIASSVEGLSGGGSVPGNSRNVGKSFLQALFHKWTSRKKTEQNNNITMGKGQNVPHIKTYYQVCVVDDHHQHGSAAAAPGMHWFVLGSHNLSKAAWGELQNGQRGPCFKVFHWELGVFISPQTLGVDRLVPFGTAASRQPASRADETICEVPLPYPFRPDRYATNDRAWTLDMIQR